MAVSLQNLEMLFRISGALAMCIIDPPYHHRCWLLLSLSSFCCSPFFSFFFGVTFIYRLWRKLQLLCSKSEGSALNLFSSIKSFSLTASFVCFFVEFMGSVFSFRCYWTRPSVHLVNYAPFKAGFAVRWIYLVRDNLLPCESAAGSVPHSLLLLSKQHQDGSEITVSHQASLISWLWPSSAYSLHLFHLSDGAIPQVIWSCCNEWEIIYHYIY